MNGQEDGVEMSRCTSNFLMLMDRLGLKRLAIATSTEMIQMHTDNGGLITLPETKWGTITPLKLSFSRSKTATSFKD